MDINVCRELQKCKDLWGQGIKEPLFFIEDLCVKTRHSQIMGKNNDCVQIFDAKTMVKYVMFGCSQDNKVLDFLSSTWDENAEMHINVVGTLGLNIFDGKVTPQVAIVDFEVLD